MAFPEPPPGGIRLGGPPRNRGIDRSDERERRRASAYDPCRVAKKPNTVPKDVARLRERMDRVNAKLVAVLQERARLARSIGRAKARHRLAAADPSREREMLAGLLASAPRGLREAELARVLRAVFAASRRLVVEDRERKGR